MEKERYKLYADYDSDIDLYDNGELMEGVFNINTLQNFLNKQDVRIKELENQVNKWKQDYENCYMLEKILMKEHQYCLDNWRECKKENKQLKENLLYEKNFWRENNKMLMQSQNQKAIECLLKVKYYFDDKEEDDDGSDGWIITNRSVVDYVNNLIKELRKE